MRADARSLLDRLGRSEFAYKEFADRFSDLELWPLFEALLKDPRLFLQEVPAHADASAPEMVTAPTIASARPAEPAPPVPPPSVATAATSPSPADAPTPPATPGTETLAELFNRYENQTNQAGAPLHSQDVRAMLRRLSELDARGQL